MPAGWGARAVAGKHLRSGLADPSCSLYVLIMAAANASARGQRAAILATGFYLAVDCLTSGCCRANLRRGGASELLRRPAHGGRGAAADAMLRRLWRPGRGRLAGDRADPQQARPASP